MFAIGVWSVSAQVASAQESTSLVTGGVGWITGAPDAEALSQAWATWAADADATAMVERIGELVEPGTNTTYLRRLA